MAKAPHPWAKRIARAARPVTKSIIIITCRNRSAEHLAWTERATCSLVGTEESARYRSRRLVVSV